MIFFGQDQVCTDTGKYEKKAIAHDRFSEHYFKSMTMRLSEKTISGQALVNVSRSNDIL